MMTLAGGRATDHVSLDKFTRRLEGRMDSMSSIDLMITGIRDLMPGGTDMQSLC